MDLLIIVILFYNILAIIWHFVLQVSRNYPEKKISSQCFNEQILAYTCSYIWISSLKPGRKTFPSVWWVAWQHICFTDTLRADSVRWLLFRLRLPELLYSTWGLFSAVDDVPTFWLIGLTLSRKMCFNIFSPR